MDGGTRQRMAEREHRERLKNVRATLEQEVAKSENTTDVAENAAKVTLETLEKHRGISNAIKHADPILKFFQNETIQKIIL